MPRSHAEGEKKEQLLTIERTCRKVAHEVPETFLEAAQLMWFYCLWDWVDCIGRFDQYIYPFYVKAKAEDEEEADDLIAAMMMHFYEHGIHNVTISGCDPKTGKDATNEVTYLMLHVLSIFHDSHPRMTVRIAKDTPHKAAHAHDTANLFIQTVSRIAYCQGRRVYISCETVRMALTSSA